MALDSPYPYFGGKSTIAGEVWQRLGNVGSYAEPFFGSGAVLLARPDWHDWASRIETVNDLDGFIANFWRAIANDPGQVAHYADWPVNENDLHARHAWLVQQKQDLQTKLEGNPDYYDAKIAGYWVWGMGLWIGGGFCSGEGPWQQVEGQLVKGEAEGISRKRPNLHGHGSKLQSLGIKRQVPHLSGRQGVSKRIPRLSHHGQGLQALEAPNVYSWFEALGARLRRVRVCSGDWLRICGPAALSFDMSSIGVFLDPPYNQESNRNMGVYSVDSGTVANDVKEWAVEWGRHLKMRIALCGYDNLTMPDGWTAMKWKAQGGYSNQGDGQAKLNRDREVVWYSPGCLAAHQLELL